MNTAFEPSTAAATPSPGAPSGTPQVPPAAAGLRALIYKAKSRHPKKPVQYLVRRSTHLNEGTIDGLVRLVAHLREEVTPQASLETALALLLEQVAPKGFPMPEGKGVEDLAVIRDEFFTEKTA